jgi:Cdc6-like AAA superfamily ATPase
MTGHHQTTEILDTLAQHQLVVYVGARGTGKTLLVGDVEQKLKASDVTVVPLDAEQAQSPTDLTAPLADVLRCSHDQLSAVDLSSAARVRVLVDNCDSLNDRMWFPALQDQWRGLLGQPEARGRVSFLLCGRPLFRRVAEGRGSPLVGIGSFVPSRPLATADVAERFAVDETVARAVLSKTGGHPLLTRRLIEAIDGDVNALEATYLDFARTQRRYLLQLIDDHGTTTRAVLADVLEGRRGNTIAESAIIARHFGSSRMLGQDTLDDLVASGLLTRQEGGVCLGASILRADRDLHQHLAAPRFTVVDEPSVEHGEAVSELFRAENRLRRNVGYWLGEVEETWWPSRFDDSLVREVEERRRAEADSPAPSATDIHPIGYLTLGELFDLILTQANWEQVFRVRIGLTRDAFNRAAATILAVRNKVAHNRPVDASDIASLRVALRRLNL